MVALGFQHAVDMELSSETWRLHAAKIVLSFPPSENEAIIIYIEEPIVYHLCIGPS